MYSRNDYWGYLDFSSYLSHHGVLGMKWGVRKDYAARKAERHKLADEAIGEYKQQKAKYKQKRDSYQKKLNAPKSQKELAKIAKAQRKVNKLKASGLTQRSLKDAARNGGTASTWVRRGRVRKLAKAEYKLAKLSRKTDKLKVKIADLDYKSAKLDKKINTINKKVKIADLKDDWNRTKIEFKDSNRSGDIKALNTKYKRQIKEIKKGD